ARLTSWGMRPVEVVDGASALRELYSALDDGDPYTVAIIDMQMPAMDGEALGKAIKADARLADTRMVMLTSMGMRGDTQRLQQIGFGAYLNKPIRHHELKAVLSQTMADRSAARRETPSIITHHNVNERLNMFAGSAVRILLAEDNIVNQQVALGILRKLGLRADAVANGAEAVRALETLPYDLVLMDVQMPVMDGFEATKRIRQGQQDDETNAFGKTPRFKCRVSRVPIIAMTAHAMQGDKERCIEAGMDDYVTKPVSPGALAEALGRWLPKENKSDGVQHTEPTPHASPAVSEKPIFNPMELPAVSVKPIFNGAELIDRLMEDEELVNEVVSGFLSEIPVQVAAVKRWLAAGDAHRVKCEAHSIKGASANVSGERLTAVAFEIEKAATAGDLDAVSVLIPVLDAQVEALESVLHKFSYAEEHERALRMQS
ncbi:MAG TPA: response regulator, partial [Bacteroidota bacterium]|nr:response regulator [Bacteroidota bacterium]